MATIDKQNKESLEEKISKLAETLAGIQERAVIEYTPLVNDICSRKAKEDEVDHLLTWMFDFVGNEKMLLLFKKVCRIYLYTYPKVIVFYFFVFLHLLLFLPKNLYLCTLFVRKCCCSA